MASQTCEQCGEEVAHDEQFCPSCGAFFDPMSTGPRARPRASAGGHVISVSSDGPSRSSEGPYEEFSLDEPPEGAAAAGEGHAEGSRDVNCPSCGALNPPNNRHCQECGARLRQGPLPTAPRPAVQATAGVRAALAISGLLFGVIIIALLFNIFTGEDSEAADSTTTTSTTLPVIVEPGPIEILDETCVPEGIGSLICANLTSGTPQEYQVSWEEVLLEEGEVTITFTFLEPMAITEIQWTNIEDTTRFRQNYRARGVTISAQDSLSPVPVELADQQGTQVVRYSALNTAKLDLTIVSAYDAEIVEENRFDELAIDEITVIGRPVTPTTTSSTTGG